MAARFTKSTTCTWRVTLPNRETVIVTHDGGHVALQFSAGYGYLTVANAQDLITALKDAFSDEVKP